MLYYFASLYSADICSRQLLLIFGDKLKFGMIFGSGLPEVNEEVALVIKECNSIIAAILPRLVTIGRVLYFCIKSYTLSASPDTTILPEYSTLII